MSPAIASHSASTSFITSRLTIVAGGPSLSAEQLRLVALARERRPGQLKVIIVNDGYGGSTPVSLSSVITP
jgi:hypothetical protein